MGCFIEKQRYEEENTFYRRKNKNLETIEESLGEKGMPKFTPAIPMNHKELFVQYVIRRNLSEIRPNKNSMVKIHYSGWVCEEGDLWRIRSAQSIAYLSSPLRLPKWLEEKFSKRSSSQSSHKSSLNSAKGSTDTLAFAIRSSTDSKSNAWAKKSTVYGKCYQHTECWLELGTGDVVEGLETIILSMSVGEEVIAFIPSRLAFGEKGLDQFIPPKADLVVQVGLRCIL